jgi:hypothetical protein
MHTVVRFTPHEFQEGDKICITGGPRKGDWLVIGVSERKLNLRCPVSGREVEWDSFCFHSETVTQKQWPTRD